MTFGFEQGLSIYLLHNHPELHLLMWLLLELALVVVDNTAHEQ